MVETGNQTPADLPSASARGTLNYATGIKPEGFISLDAIITRLGTRDILFWATIACKFVLGAAASFILPAFVFFLQFNGDRLFTPTWEMFWYVYGVVTAISFLVAWWWSDNDLLDQVAYLGRTYGPLDKSMPFTQTSWDWEMKQSGGEMMIYVGLMVFGPRWIVSGLQQCYARIKLRGVKFPRAAEALYMLMQFDHGIAPWELRRTGEEDSDLPTALAFLRLQEWIDVGKKGQKVWVCSTARKRLAGAL